MALAPDRTVQPGQSHRAMLEESPKERATEPSTSAERFRLGRLHPRRAEPRQEVGYGSRALSPHRCQHDAIALPVRTVSIRWRIT